MAEKLFDFGIDPATGLQCAGYEEDGQVIIVNEQPAKAVQAHLDHNAQVAQAAKDHMLAPGSTGGFLARIPPITYHRWKREWQNGPKAWGVLWNKGQNSFLARKLRSSENKHLRFANL